jgi:UDP-4-amino-4,6-dideoxy-N-acetyl-beta-L-altrosamine transaminase
MKKTGDYIPYGKHEINDDDIKAIYEVLKSNFITQGPKVQEFEEKLSEIVDVKYSVAVSNATSALHLACLALGLKKGDLVWTSPNTFVASANCARYCNSDIDFVDINLHDGLMDIEKLSNKLKKARTDNRLPKIVIPVHFAGTSCDMESISKLSKEYGFYVIEDASHALGGRYHSKAIGSCEFSDFTVFSFHPVKIITTGEGGAICTKNPKLAEKVKTLRSHGIVKNPKLFKNKFYGPWSYEQQTLGFNFRMNDIQAALGISQINRLDQIISERNRLLNLYKNKLSQLPLYFLDIPKDVLSSVHLCVICLNQCTENQHRDIFEALRGKGIGTQLHYWPVHLNPYYRDLGFKEGDFINSEIYANRALSLPLFPGLKDVEIDYVSHVLEETIKDIID